MSSDGQSSSGESSFNMPPGMIDAETIASLDPGIREVVIRLNAWGFITTDSGDGVSKTDMECAESLPHVYMVVADNFRLVSEAVRLKWELRTHLGLFLGPIGEGRIQVQATFDPCDESIGGIIAIYGLDDTLLKSALVTKAMRTP